MTPKSKLIPMGIVEGLAKTFRAIELIPIGPGQPGYREKLAALQEVNNLQDGLLAHFKAERERPD